jgi:hypothetical protein
MKILSDWSRAAQNLVTRGAAYIKNMSPSGKFYSAGAAVFGTASVVLGVSEGARPSLILGGVLASGIWSRLFYNIERSMHGGPR